MYFDHFLLCYALWNCYLMLVSVEGEELSKDVQALGFPIEHKHKLCCLRQELIDSFVE